MGMFYILTIRETEGLGEADGSGRVDVHWN